MTGLHLVLGIVVMGVIVVAGTLISIYNILIAGRLKVKEAFSGIYVQLKRRADLIPNLVNVVRGYKEYEAATLENITKLRTSFLNTDPADRAAVMAQGTMLSAGLKTMFAVAEHYPDLKANQNFLKLQESLEETEDQVAASRRIYNANVTTYNTSVQTFPSIIIAKWFKFNDEPFFETDKSAETTPTVSI